MLRRGLTALREVRILLVGPTNAGKTTLTKAIDEKAKTISAPSGATVYMDVGVVIYDKVTGQVYSFVPPDARSRPDRYLKLKIIGTPGHERYRYQRDLVLTTTAREVDVVALVVDSADENSIAQAGKILSEVLSKVKTRHVLLVANKQDLPNARKGKELAQVLGIQHYVETSALYRVGIDEFLRKVVELAST